MKRGGFLRNVLDTIRSNQAGGQSGRGQGGSAAAGERGFEFGGQLRPSHFSLGHVARHGFPEQPSALAFDPVQKIAAIGTRTGAIRVFGRPGVDVWAQHEPGFAVTHMKFIVNQGALITVTADESVHLWSLRGPHLRLQFSSGGQGASGPSAACSPAPPTPASNISSGSSQSTANNNNNNNSSSLAGASMAASTNLGGSASTTPSSFLGQISDTVSGAVDSASDFLSGGGGGSSTDHHHHNQTTPSPTSQTVDAGSRAHRLPELLHTLKFQREHITCIHQTLASKWLYIGTERGNVHVANVETFELSGYSIQWNKAIELSRKAHPGSIIHLSECPQDTNKLLIGYESGCIVIWDLKQRNAEGRYYHTENLLWLAWHYEGKQFVAAHGDGSLITWQARSNTKPVQILHPHAKTAASSGLMGDGGAAAAAPSAGQAAAGAGGLQHEASDRLQHHHSLATSIARSLNNELYRPINKIEWKTSKSSSEQFLLFSGGLPYDNLDQPLMEPSVGQGARFGSQSAHSPASQPPPLDQSQVQQQQQQHSNRAGSSGFISAGGAGSGLAAKLMPASSATGAREKRNLRSTSLTVMYGKSITVLEMDDIIVDFITICDNSPYENDQSDPYAVIVLLSNELVLIDLTSSGYPSFDSPYPSASLSESPVTCVQYLADCSADLIPYLYSTSHNVFSRAPKKGFSDKEWPINGGEWGQSMQSYPELVLTGHADGTIKFWDMSGINFDLISKIKTSKLFDRPCKLSGPIIFAAPAGASLAASKQAHQQQQQQQQRAPQGSTAGACGAASVQSLHQTRPSSPFKQQHQAEHSNHSSSSPTAGFGLGAGTTMGGEIATTTIQTALDESLFAIEKIEFCPSTKRLLVAGAFSQVIQFKLNKREAAAASQSAPSGELTTILVEPHYNPVGFKAAPQQLANQHKQQQHLACLQQFVGRRE